jgi:uncharacterized membrane protein
LMALLAITAAHIYKVWKKLPDDRPRVIGLLLFICGIVAIGLAIGVGRGNWDYDRGLLPHYAIIATPLLCCLYFIGTLQSSWAKLLQVSLVLMSLALLPANTLVGFHVGSQLHHRIELFQQDASAGIPIFILDERYGDVLNPWRSNFPVEKGLEMLRRAGIGAFQYLRPDPIFRESSVLVEPIEPAEKRAELVLDLKQSQFVYAIRVRYSYGDPESGSAFLRVEWKRTQTRPNETEVTGSGRIQVQTGRVPIVDTISPHNSSGMALPDTILIPRLAWTREKTETFWVNATIDELRVYPDDKPRLFTAKEVDLLVPDDRRR